MLGAGLGALLGGEIITVTGLLLYLYVAEPLISHVTALGQITAYLPGVTADGLTQASQAGVRLLPPWQGGLVLAAWAAAIAAAGAVRTTRRDITRPVITSAQLRSPWVDEASPAGRGAPSPRR